MARRRKKAPSPPIPPQQSKGSHLQRFLAGRPTVGGLVSLLLIALVIGVSGGYLAHRITGSTTGGVAADPTAALRGQVQQNPKDVEGLLKLAHTQLDQQQLDSAESLYRQVLALEPKNVEAITHLGNVLLARGQADAALRNYEEALKIQPDYIHALWDKANLLQEVKKDYPAAIRTWEVFIKAVGPDSQDGKTAQQFIAEARRAMEGGSSPVGKAFGDKS